MKHARCLVALAALLLAVPATAADIVIDSGLDVWYTRADGSTFFSFSGDPLPADFFCSGSAPFAGQIVLKGVPIATQPAGALGSVDTILERLDDAVFDESGVATTRLQMKAMHLAGVQTFVTECGDFLVDVVLDGEQPVTEMRIQKARDLALRGRPGVEWGFYEADVAVGVKMRFHPLDGQGPVREVARHVVFPPRLNSVWAARPGEKTVRHAGWLEVDTDADGRPDTALQGTSQSFFAGYSSVHDGIPGLKDALTRPLLDEGLAERIYPCPPECHCGIYDTQDYCVQHCLGSSGDVPAY